LGWGPGSNEVGQKSLNLALLWRHPQKSSNPKLSNFFNRSYKTYCIFRGFEQLSSSIGWRIEGEQTLSNPGS